MFRKVLLSLVLVMVMAISIPSFALAASDAVVKTPAIDGSLNVRSGPGTKYSVVGWVKNGYEIQVLSEGAWSKIKVEKTGKIGYIRDIYIVEKPSAPETPDGYKEVAKVTTKTKIGIVNLREEASSSSATLAKLKRGARLTILDKENSWYLVKTFDGKKGYIYKDYISKTLEAKVTASSVNMRKGGSTKYAVIDVLTKNAPITVLAVGTNWSKIKFDDTIGFMSNKYYVYK